MGEAWTLGELVEQVANRLAALPAPKNGQVRAVPDDRTIRYYGTIGLLDKPAAMRGRTALYNRKHLAQVVAIKRMQSLGRSLAEIQTMWPTMDDATLGRMAGVQLAAAPSKLARKDFWKPGVTPTVATPLDDAELESQPMPTPTAPTSSVEPIELRIPLAPNVIVTITLPDDAAISPNDLRAIRVAAQPLLNELARRQLATQHRDPNDHDPQDNEGGDV